MLRRHSQCSLEMIHLSKDDLDDEGWRALSRVLCDKASIEQIYTSNHTLCTIQMITRPFDEESSYWNREEIPDMWLHCFG